MGSSVGANAPTGKGAAKATVGKKGKAGVLNTAVEVGKVVDEVNTPEEKQKIFKENGMEVKEDDIELAWEELMQVKLASLASKKVVAGKKQGKQVQPVAAGK